MKTGLTIVLCGGPLNPTNVPIGRHGSNAMVPINGKPVIGWIFDDLVGKGIASAVVVLRRANERVADFLRRAFDHRIDVSTVFLDRDGSILDSLAAGLRGRTEDGPVRVVLGDTLIRDAFAGDGDFIYAGDVEDSRRWCVVKTNAEGHAETFADKKELPGHSHRAVAGYYHFTDRALLARSLDAALADGERELSAVLSRYGATRPIAVRQARQWYDFGHVDNCVRAKRELLQCRFFNSLAVDPILNTITKVSTDNEKLEDELFWYLNIPDELKVLTPRIVSHRRIDGNLEIVQEYYGYPTLAELFVYSGLSPDAWRAILRHVLRIHDQFRRHPVKVCRDEIVQMYAGKTRARLDALAASDPEWCRLLSAPSLTCDGRRLRNVPELWAGIDRAAEALADTAIPAVVHGDFCFSNILFDFNNQIVRLIDPRGRFGRRGIGGDARYDLAKLRHSAHGLYDFIVADMFQLDWHGDVVSTSIPAADPAVEVAALFDELLADHGHDVSAIQQIEGLLFLSMVPLHRGHLRRQQMMFFTGLKLLNEAL